MCKIINASDLRNRTDEELGVLFRIVSQKLAQTEVGLDARRNMLASLENISHAISARWAQHLKPPGC